jgi:hypothetical protein
MALMSYCQFYVDGSIYLVTAQLEAAHAMIDLGQATHYLCDEPGNPPCRTTTVDIR